MHEYGIAQQMLRTAVEYAEKNGAQRIVRLDIQVSALGDENAESLRFYLQTLSEGTPAEGAEIAVERVMPRAVCLNCGAEFTLEPAQFHPHTHTHLPDGTVVYDEPETVAAPGHCPQCGSAQVRPRLGDEFRLVSIGVE